MSIIGNTVGTPMNPNKFAGKSDVHIGANAPSDPNAKVWINPDAEIDPIPAASEGEFELIETVTITEDSVKGVHRSKEPNGKNYAFTAMHVEVNSPAVTAATHGYVYFRGANAVNLVGGYFSNMMATNKRTAKAAAHSFHGYWKYAGGASGVTGDTGGSSISGSTIVALDMSKTLKEEPYLAGVGITLINAYFPLDTTINIYGVRANA